MRMSDSFGLPCKQKPWPRGTERGPSAAKRPIRKQLCTRQAASDKAAADKAGKGFNMVVPGASHYVIES